MRHLPAVCFACALAAGCGGKDSSTAPPQYDPDDSTRAVLNAYDANKNGSIEAAEAEASPALKAAFRAIDTNRDGVLSADELRQRFARYDEVTSGAGSLTVTCQVTVDG